MSKRTKPYLLHASIRPDVDVDFEAYPFSIPAVREIGSIDFHPNVTFFVGENGSGKSTVMEGIALALGFSAEGGTRNVRFESAGEVSALHDSLRLKRWQLLPSQTAIQPIIIGGNEETMRLSAALYEQGIWVGGIRPPTVPAGSARLRITLSASHSADDVRRLADAINELERT